MPPHRRRPTDPLEAVRERCLTLPEVTERVSHGGPAWFVRDRRQLASFVDDHHGDGIVGMWCAAPAGVQESLVAALVARLDEEDH